MSSPSDYTVGWICALPIEAVAATAFLDQRLEPPAIQAKKDANNYKYGKIKEHYVVIAILPMGEYGNSPAASVAKDLTRSFPNIRIGLMVGIGGGAPSSKHDIRLGDVVVSIPEGGQSGVFQYDYGKSLQDEEFRHTRVLDQPPQLLRTAVGSLEVDHMMDGNGLEGAISEVLEQSPRLVDKFGRPSDITDILFQPKFKHNGGDSCGLCNPDPINVVKRERRKDEKSLVHFGTIASANSLVKDALLRDKLASEKNVLCFEMEAAGLMNGFPCLVIRGICDYSDTHKNELWQGYAAMAAAAYAKQITSLVLPEEVEQESKLAEIQTQLDEITRTAKAVRSQQEREEESRILTWLSQTNFGQQQTDNLRKWHPGTLQWLFESYQYQAWIRNTGEVLFCPGIPGAGKTVSASAVIHDLTQRFSSDANTGIAFLYCSYTQSNDHHTTGLLASILKQLLQLRSAIPNDLKDLYIEHQKQQTEAQHKDILRVLKSHIAVCSRVMVVVDALDEWQRPRDDTFNLLDELLSLQNECHINLFVTSRFVPTILAKFHDYPSLSITASQGDIARYISNHNWSSSSLICEKPNLQKKIELCISQASKGMFLLAQFYLRSLEDKTTPRELTDALELYQDRADRKENDQNFDMLAEAYDEVMDRINQQNASFRRRAHEVLSWVCYAKKELSVSELQAAIAVVESEGEIQEEDLCPINLLLSTCCGIVVIVEAAQTIQLVHYTAQDYFLNRRQHWLPYGQSYLAKQCINYLSLRTFQDKSPTGIQLLGKKNWTEIINLSLIKIHELDEVVWEHDICQDDRDTTDQFALYDYAVENWGHHVRFAEDGPKGTASNLNADVPITTISVSDVNRAVLSLLRCRHTIHMALKVQLRNISHNQFCEIENLEVNALHMAAFYGLDRIIPSLLAEFEINSKDSNGRTALAWASVAGWVSTVQLLLSSNSDIEAVDLSGCTALFDATRSNHLDVVRLLVDWGANIHVVASNGDTALHYAVGSEQDRIAHLLLDQGAVLDILNAAGELPVSIAVRNGSRPVYERLVQMGANPGSCGDNRRTILMEAACVNDVDLVKDLLKQEVNLDAQDRRNRTALIEACEKGHEKIVEMLLQHGAEPNIQDCGGQNALMKAIEEGHKEIAELLLKEGLNQDQVDKDGCTSLMYAARNRHFDIIRLLLQYGADQKMIDKFGLTALAHAIDQGSDSFHPQNGGCIELVSQLLNGEPLNLHHYRALLSWARPNGYAVALQLLLEGGESQLSRLHNGLLFLAALEDTDNNVIRLLRDCGVDLRDCDKETSQKLIIEASGVGNEEMVRWLIERGIDVRCKNELHQTPIMMASRWGHGHIVKLLRSEGATFNPFM